VLGIWFVGRFYRSLRDELPDLVHVHSSAYMSFWEKCTIGRIAQEFGIPWILHMHDGYFEEFLPKLRSPFADAARWCLKSASGVVVPCHRWHTWLAEWVPDDRLHEIPNGIDPGRFVEGTGAVTSRVRVLFVGDVSPEKGVEDLAKAFINLERHYSHKNVDLWLVGKADRSPFVEQVKGLFCAAGCEDRVSIPGPLYGEEKLAAFRSADIFVLPSHRESFGIVNLEAMASGLPVISTDTGAIPEVVRNGVEGIVVQPKDIAGLTGALHLLIQDRGLRTRMGVAARQRANEYDWISVSERLAQLYDSILS
jgi:glycosyltransferase involved in cell wall biosynthesis